MNTNGANFQIKIASELKEEQLGQLEAILSNEKYNTTGLGKNNSTNSTSDDYSDDYNTSDASQEICKGLEDYIDEAKENHKEEVQLLKEDETLLNIHRDMWNNTIQCPCVWKEWGAWSECTKTCGEGDQAGTKERSREVAKEAKGDEVTQCQDEESYQSEICNQQCSRKNLDLH